eukprot:TRINITY_DN15959_c0_g1_i1.p3 TRINITY_DN15959_c0_g1~~TRINITY_DN15959_c0_g1_i1.p3  ORF type:complete len:102 (+),score=15.46 TRINITY_DN15959_c0_g1_i1:269-574(+)
MCVQEVDDEDGCCLQEVRCCGCYQEMSSVVIIQSRPVLEKCSSIKNETCSDIKKYSGCGFCVESKYPLVGSGCAYKKQMMKMDAASKKYDVVVAIKRCLRL